ncbi:argininosuccinate synthetase [Coemansia sp. RSA 2322]|nr:argininosuccinate synthetase [Coemansia sp. RSA 2322]
MSAAAANSKGKVLLAYSGGLDTSCILVWLIEQGYEVLAYMANVGQEEDFDAAREKALKVGASKVFIEDLRRELVEELVIPTIQANAVYETAPPPKLKVIAPWRIPEFYHRFPGRNALLAYAAEKCIPVSQTPSKPWSTDENLFHISYEAGILEDPNVTPPADMWKLTVDPEDAPNTPERITITFKAGKPVRVTNEADSTDVSDPLELFLYLNAVARRNGVGRIDIVENRFIGIKSRGCYETPGGTVLRAAHIDLEGLVLDREVRAYRDEHITPVFGKILYNGLYFSPEGDLITKMVPLTQANVNGSVRVKLYKGSLSVEGRWSESETLYDMEQSSMDVQGDFEPTDSDGFIKIQSIRLKKWGATLQQQKKN